MSKADATTTEEGATVTVNVDKLIPDETKRQYLTQRRDALAAQAYQNQDTLDDQITQLDLRREQLQTQKDELDRQLNLVDQEEGRLKAQVAKTVAKLEEVSSKLDALPEKAE
jgi:chromosome segregation ATPase